MHILAIGWIYVVTMMAITEKTVTASLLTLILYCVLPLGLLLILTRRKKSGTSIATKNHPTDTPINPSDGQAHQPDQSAQRDSNKP